VDNQWVNLVLQVKQTCDQQLAAKGNEWGDNKMYGSVTCEEAKKCLITTVGDVNKSVSALVKRRLNQVKMI